MKQVSQERNSNNWYVITGGPSSGKTTTVNMLSERGYKTTIEHARHFIDTMHQSGRTVEEIRRNQQEFQSGILEMQIEQEAMLSANDMVFLDRAIPDALAYYRFLNLEVDERLTKAMQTASYKKVFILELLPFVKDYARTEDEDAQKEIHSLLVDVYTSLPSQVIRVPVLSPEERVSFILKNL
jgi:predicted ATPase